MTSFVFDAAACRAQNQSFSAQRAEMARRWRAGARVNLNLDLLNTVDIVDTYLHVGRYRFIFLSM